MTRPLLVCIAALAVGACGGDDGAAAGDAPGATSEGTPADTGRDGPDTATTPTDTRSTGDSGPDTDTADPTDSVDTATPPFTPFTGHVTVVADGSLLGHGATLVLADTTVAYAPTTTWFTLSNPTDDEIVFDADPTTWLVGDARVRWQVPPPAQLAAGDTADVALELVADHEGDVEAELHLLTDPPAADPFVLQLDSVVHGPVPTVIVGRLGRTLVSWDHGLTWDDRQEVTDPYANEWNHERSLQSVTWGGGRFVAVGGGNGVARVSHSDDGTAWTDAKVSGGPLNHVAFGVLPDGTGRFAALRGNDWLWSADGELWIEEPADGWEGQASLVFGGDRWVSVGNSYRGVSLDGQTWDSTTDGASLNEVAYGNGVFVAVGNNGLLAWSSDGVTWHEQTVGTVNRGRIAYGDGVFVTGGWPEGMLTSPDGQAWTTHTVDEVGLLGFSNGTFVADSWRDRLWASPDGLAWAQVQDNSSPEWAGFTALAVAQPPHLR